MWGAWYWTHQPQPALQHTHHFIQAVNRISFIPASAQRPWLPSDFEILPIQTLRPSIQQTIIPSRNGWSPSSSGKTIVALKWHPINATPILDLFFPHVFTACLSFFPPPLRHMSPAGCMIASFSPLFFMKHSFLKPPCHCVSVHFPLVTRGNVDEDRQVG